MRLSTAFLALLVAALSWVAVWGSEKENKWVEQAKRPAAVDPVAEKLVAFVGRHNPKVDPDYLRYVTSETRRLSSDVNHGDKLETLLAMFYVESNFRQGVLGDDGRSYGIAQTLLHYEDGLRAWWEDRGQRFGSIDDPTTQVAFGVAEFSRHWYYARRRENRLFETVRGYNGGANGGNGLKMATRYAKKVFRTRKAIFGE